MAQQTVCRWGILATSNIARKNSRAIHRAQNAQLLAVGSRTKERAVDWAAEQNIERAYATYDELLNDAEVNAVYLPVPTAFRADWACKAAEKGKHVLLEKPVGVVTAELRRVLAACEKNGVQMMDGTMFVHHPRLNAIKSEFSNVEEFGRVTHVMSTFTFPGDRDFLATNIRCNPETEPLGCMGDLGWYNIRFSLWTFGYELPTSVQCNVHQAVNTVPVDASATLTFADGRSATFHCSFVTGFRQAAEVVGEKAYVRVTDFVIPEQHGDPCYYEVDKSFGLKDFDTKVDCSRRKRVEVPGVMQETAMFERFSSNVLSGNVEAEWPQQSLKTQLVLDACMRSATNGGKTEALEAL